MGLVRVSVFYKVIDTAFCFLATILNVKFEESSPMDCHLSVVERFEFSMILRAMLSVVFSHFHQGHPWC